jgi:Protein of unknown function (DUF2585).
MTTDSLSQDQSRSWQFWAMVFVTLLVAQAVTLYLMGRVPICECGYIKLFEPGVNTPGNSQHIGDWYTPSHIIHGFLFYLFTWWGMRKASLGARLTVASVIEIAWEILENSPIIIERYRNETMAIGYTGDSVLNSVMDTVFMALGFLFAARAPVWLTIAVAIIFELFTGWLIRDNLTLNVLMLAWPVEAVKVWQAGL